MKKTKLFPLSILLLFSLAACDRGSSASSSSPSESRPGVPSKTDRPIENPSSANSGSGKDTESAIENSSLSSASASESSSVSYPKGTVNNPFSCKDAYSIASKLGDKVESEKAYYFYGKVTHVKEISTEFGNATFTITSEETDLIFYRGRTFNGEKFTDPNQVKVKDEVVIYGTVQRYDGKLETGKNAYLYSLNGKTADGTSVTPTPGGDPENVTKYYSSITESRTGGSNGTLRVALTNLIKPKAYYTYSGKGTNTLSNILQDADEDPNNKENRIYFYTQKSVKKNPAEGWNREHVWPQSLSGGLYGKTGAGADILHIRPTYDIVNSTRGNRKYADCPNGKSVSYEGVIYGKTASGYFEPIDSVKGDVARICLYRWTCYFASRNTPLTNVTDSVSTLVEWNTLDPVSQQEKHRNEVAASSKQANRNPFVDHPEWVNKIFQS